MKISKSVATQSSGKPTEEWNNWSKIQKYVFKLQRRIYSASIDNNLPLLIQLQHTLIQSRSAKLLTVWRSG